MQHSRDHRLYPEGPSFNPKPVRYLLLLVLGLLGTWGFAKIDSDRPTAMAAMQVQPGQLQPSEAAEVYRLEPDEGGRTPGQLGLPAGARMVSPPPSMVAPPDLSEGELAQTLAELDAAMSRTARLAKRLGQLEAYATLEVKQAKLSRTVAESPKPLSQHDRDVLDDRARTLRAEVAKFSQELEEVASVQL